jgi:hypothetical protein
LDKNTHENPSSSSSDNSPIKRKFHRLVDDENNVLCKTHKDNETTTSSTSDDDYNIKIRRGKLPLNKTNEESPIKLRRHIATSNNHINKTNNVIINYNSSTIINDPSLEDSLSIVDDLVPMDEDQMLKDVIENNDNESIFASLDITHEKITETNSNDDVDNIINEKTTETNYNDDIEDISHDGIDDSIDDR